MYYLNFISTGEQKSFNIGTTATWVITSSDTWLTFSTMSGTGNGTVSVTAQSNTITSHRTATITINGNQGDCQETILVTQEASVPSPFLNVLPSTLSYGFNRESKNFDVSSNVVWGTITSNQSWLTITPTSGSNTLLNLTATAEDNLGTQRTAIITVPTNPVGIVASQTISVTQAAFVAGPFLTVSPPTLSYSDVGGTNTFDVTSNVNWTITSSETWLTISQLSGSNTINGLIATASANTGGTSRTAIITVFETGNPSLNGIINVTQAAFIQNSYLNVSPSTFQFDGCYIGNLYDAKVFSITSNVNWLVTCSEPWIEISSLTTGSNDRDIRFYPSIVNDSSTSRTATITVSDTNTVNPAAPQTITITQNASVINEFFLRLDNQTGSTVTCLSFYTSDLIHPSGTGNPFLTYAAIENTDGTIRTDIKTIDRGLIDFTVSNGEKCIFRIKWVCGVFPLGCRTILSPFYNICTSGGCKISGDYDIPSDFMARLFRDSPVYTHQAGDTYDMSGLRPQNIGSGFFRRTWDNCQSLINPIVPITDSWNPSTIENDFLYETWRGCNGLVYTISPNTTNWNNMKTIGNNFMYQTFHYGGEYITYAIAPNTLNWNITSIGSEFMTRTWMTLNRYNNIDVTIQGEIYVGDIQPLGTQCAGFHYDNNRINRVIVGSQPLVVRFQNSTYWSEISDSKFVAS